MDHNNIQSVIDINQCTGCCACVSICPVNAISISKDVHGFITPHIDTEKCIQCGKCRMTCPSLELKMREPIDCYAGISKSGDLLLKSSSGAIFPTIAKKILEEGGIVYGAAMTSDFKVRHIRVADSENLSSILGSKYIQSYMGNKYDSIINDLKNGKTVLFSGTPCMTSAVKNYCSNIGTGKLILIDVVCHGVPSQDFFDSYLAYLRERTGEIDSYRFRAKRYEKNGMNWFFSIRKKPEKRSRIYNWPEDPFNYLYMMSYIYRESCYSCKYACSKRPGDITLCDFWGWDRYHYEFPIGSTVSGILINTDIGKEIFDGIKNSISFVKTDYSNIRDNNGCLKKPSDRPSLRDSIFTDWKNEGFAEVVRKYSQKNRKALFKAKLVRLLPAVIIGFYNRKLSYKNGQRG